jgi:hypothetical protein
MVYMILLSVYPDFYTLGHTKAAGTRNPPGSSNAAYNRNFHKLDEAPRW